MDAEYYDSNITPDKRTIMFKNEKYILDEIKKELSRIHSETNAKARTVTTPIATGLKRGKSGSVDMSLQDAKKIKLESSPN